MTRYFEYDYWGHSEEDLTPKNFLDAVGRLLEGLPEEVAIKNLAFGVDHQFDRDPYNQDGYYLVWVSDRRGWEQ